MKNGVSHITRRRIKKFSFRFSTTLNLCKTKAWSQSKGKLFHRNQPYKVAAAMENLEIYVKQSSLKIFWAILYVTQFSLNNH